MLGWNARMNEFQAALILVNLKYLNAKTLKRQELANIYSKNINIKCVKPNIEEGHMVAQYSILVENREGFINHLKNNNIAHKIFYHKQDFAKFYLLGYIYHQVFEKNQSQLTQ